ncbi:hypothetical protein MAM1_0903d11349, partial [Mucor ambiguus]
MMLSLGARCCCECRSLAVLAMFSLGNLVLASAVYCRLFAVLVLSTATAAGLTSAGVDAHLLYWRCFIVLIWCYLLLLLASTGCVGDALS